MSRDVFIVRMNWFEDSLWQRLFLSKGAIVADILTGDLGDHASEIAVIWRTNDDEHTCDNIVEEIARAVAIEADGGDISVGVRDFIEKFGSIALARGLRVIDTFAAA